MAVRYTNILLSFSILSAYVSAVLDTVRWRERAIRIMGRKAGQRCSARGENISKT
ncbi:MAG: hypothetical protein GXP63_00375 [DPANN group archaeon]|nr:hypothetical protein [DPANN group archaeon]